MKHNVSHLVFPDKKDNHFEIVHVEATAQQNSREDNYPDLAGEAGRQPFSAVRLDHRGEADEEVRIDCSLASVIFPKRNDCEIHFE